MFLFCRLWKLSKGLENEEYFGKERELLLGLEKLLDGGADPTWLPQQGGEDSSRVASSQGHTENALLIFFEALIPLLVIIEKHYSKQVIKQLQDILCRLIKKYLAFKVPMQRNFLHAIFDYNDGVLRRTYKYYTIPAYVWCHLLEILAETLLTDQKELINETDWKGNVPFHFFIGLFRNWKEMDREIILRFFDYLKSEENIAYQNKDGRTVLQTLFDKFNEEEDLRIVWEILPSLKAKDTTSGDILLMMIQKAGVAIRSKLYPEIIGKLLDEVRRDPKSVQQAFVISM